MRCLIRMSFLTSIHLLLIWLFHCQPTYSSSSSSSSNLFPSNSSSSFLPPQLCSRQENSALLNFKNSFSINSSAFSIDSFVFFPCDKSYQKTDSWKENTDCCTWVGVTCDRRTGHVIGLDMSCSWFFGTFHSNNTLFRLPHLQRLNLAYNDFNQSQIPSEFGTSLTGLTHLDLKYSGFSGQIPAQLSHLSKLVSLNLSQLFPYFGSNLEVQKSGGVELRKHNFKRLVQNLTELRELVLDGVDMSSVDLGSLRNLSSFLISLSLSGCELQGRLPDHIFRLPNLQMLYLSDNDNLTGFLPKGNWSSPLRILDLGNTSFSGKLPNSIGNLKSLSSLGLYECHFYGPLPASLGNLTQLTDLFLIANQFSGEIPLSMSNLVHLQWLYLSFNNLSGQLPSSILNLTQLQNLDLSYNQFVGSVPSSLSNLVHLQRLDLSTNNLSGQLPSSILNLTQLQTLQLSSNQFVGSVPSSLSNLVHLQWLDLSKNNLSGQLPSSIVNLTQLDILDLSYNQFVGSIPSGVIWPPNLIIFQLNDNQLSGTIPSWLYRLQSMEILDFSNNKLTGRIEEFRCRTLSLINLSNNELQGPIPCLGNFSSSLKVLDLHRNRFHGPIPQTFARGSVLRSLDVSDNKLQGLVPRSLVNCTELEVLNLGNNDILDTFPFWLDILPKLQVLILRSNRFHGPILQPKRKSAFSNLTIIDLSYNNFTGVMPSKFFKSLRSMATINDGNSKLEYIGGKQNYYFDSVTIVSKGLKLELVRILTIFKAIDFSNNNFEGEIPNSIGNLKSVRVLNVSGNSLRGHIPSSLGNLSEIESLDLSHNNLSGEIPKELASLKWLSVFDVSQNHLEGPIPQGNQFNTFSNNSYEGNSRLCGFPLTKKCGSGEKAPSPPLKAEESQSSSKFTLDIYEWIVVLMGYGCGLVIGVVGGNYIMQRKEEWLMKTFGIGQHWRARRLNRKRQNGTRGR